MKKNTFNTIVPIDCHGYRIDKFLQLQINKLSRTRLQGLILDGQVKLNNITNITEISSDRPNVPNIDIDLGGLGANEERDKYWEDIEDEFNRRKKQAKKRDEERHKRHEILRDDLEERASDLSQASKRTNPKARYEPMAAHQSVKKKCNSKCNSICY